MAGQNDSHFIYENRHPRKAVQGMFSHNVINAVAIALNIPWQEGCRRLIEQAKRLNRMPDEPQCATEFLLSNGFFQVPRRLVYRDAADFCNSMCGKDHGGEVYVGKVGHGIKYANAFAILPQGSNNWEVRSNRNCEHTYIDKLWVRWPDGAFHGDPKVFHLSRRTPAKPSSSRRPDPDSEYFHYYRANPSRNTGDCVIRGLAGVLDISWERAMDLIAISSGYTETTLNHPPIFERVLEASGYTPHKAMKKGGRYLTAREFCDLMTHRCFHEERIFAYVTQCHVAAVLQFDGEPQRHYKMVDSWDSSVRSISKYWVSKPEETPPPECPEAAKVGASVLHPKYGEGIITKAFLCSTTWIITVDFGGCAKDITAAWAVEQQIIKGDSTDAPLTCGGAA